MHKDFAYKIERWYEANGRELPWRETREPYHIWLSEIILQQTRVEQGRAYYERFLKTFPTVEDLAKAEEEEVMRVWQGLGYYSRARNLHAAAKRIVEWGGFPVEYEKVLSLPGVGPYTAAAIMSFAYDEPWAVVDGNVYRVISRYLGLENPIDSNAGKTLFQKIAQEMIDKTHPALYNQAIMDFGALICKPKSPQCEVCPVMEKCTAFAQGRVEDYPVKERSIKQRERFLTYVYVRSQDGYVLIHRRTEKDIWQGLYEFLLIESDHPLREEEVRKQMPEGVLIPVCQGYIHQLTHQRLYTDLYLLTVSKQTDSLPGQWIREEEMENYAMPQLLVRLRKKLTK